MTGYFVQSVNYPIGFQLYKFYFANEGEVIFKGDGVRRGSVKYRDVKWVFKTGYTILGTKGKKKGYGEG